MLAYLIKRLSTITFPVKLIKGYNTIRIANSTGWLPDIDKIELDLNRYDTTLSNKGKVSTLPIRIYPNPCQAYLQIDSKSPVKQVDIYSLTGTLLKQYTVAEISTDDLAPGTYILKVITDSRTIIQQFCKQ